MPPRSTVSHGVVRKSDGATVAVVESVWFTDGQTGTDNDGFPDGGILDTFHIFGCVPASVVAWHYGQGATHKAASRYTLRPVR
jgi:hypothetical protein